MLGQHPDGDGAVQTGIAGLIDLPHAARAERGLDLVGAEGGASGEWHVDRVMSGVAEGDQRVDPFLVPVGEAHKLDTYAAPINA